MKKCPQCPTENKESAVLLDSKQAWDACVPLNPLCVPGKVEVAVASQKFAKVGVHVCVQVFYLGCLLH